VNDMRRLNENGLIKALPLIEEVLGISGKLRVDGDNLLLDGFRLSIDIPDNWVISEDIGVTADGPVGSNPDPSGYVPATVGRGEKERDTGIKRLGRAEVEKNRGEKANEVAKEVAKEVAGKFVSKPELEKYLKSLEDKTLDIKTLQQAFEKFGQLLSRSG